MAGVGAPRGQGRVYLYRRSQRTIDPTQGLVVEMPESHGRFGHALALSGQHLVVGAPDIDWEKRESGAVFGFDLSLGYPRLTHQVASSEEATRGFGNQLALRSEQLAVSAVVGEVTVLPWLSPPSLNVSSEGERLSLTWTPKPGNTYRLEESPSLRSASWQEVEIRTQVGLHTITREAENRARFYRLLVMPE